MYALLKLSRGLTSSDLLLQLKGIINLANSSFPHNEARSQHLSNLQPLVPEIDSHTSDSKYEEYVH
jgi:hypothetical protein